MSESHSKQGCSATSCANLVLLALMATIVVIGFTPAYNFFRRAHYYGEAEAVVADLQKLTRELDSINESSVREKLATDEYSHLNSRQIKIRLRSREMMWFRVNDMFQVGLANDGAILWMVDGKRSGD